MDTTSITGRVALCFLGARGLQVRRKDKDLMQDTGGVSKGRDREPTNKPPRDDRKERYRDRRLTPEQIDEDTNQHKDRPVKQPSRRPQAALTDEEISAVSDAVKKEIGGQSNNKHKLRVFDFDDTLVSSESSVKVKHADGETTDLDSASFAYFTPNEGDKINFSDFNHVTRPRLIKKGMDALRDAVGDGEARTVILTARPKGSASAVKKFLEGQGVKGVDVVALQSSDPMDKARWIEKNMEDVDDIEFTDDSSKNVEAVATLKGKTKRFQMNNPSHPTESDYEGRSMQDVFKSDVPTTVEIEKSGPKSPSGWWRGQTKEFQQQYCKMHPESKYCGG
jgi:hypothetical protein